MAEPQQQEEAWGVAERSARQCAQADGPLVLTVTEAQAFGASLGQLLASHHELFTECWEWYRRYYGLLAALGQQAANDPNTV
jgi:hypothetical protein